VQPVLLYYDVLQYQPSTLERLARHFALRRLPHPGADTDEALQSVEVVMAPLGYPFDRAKIERCRTLRVIASATVTVPHIDVAYARSQGIEVCWLGDEADLLATLTPTAEVAWGLVVSVTRMIPAAHRAACDGRWGGRPFGQRTPRMLSAMTLGIVGLGRLGRMVASYGAAFGMPVSYYSPSSTDPAYAPCATLAELAERSDIVSVHARHTPDTERLIDRAFIRAMRPGSFLINTARGELVDEGALLEALEDGHLAGAGLDVLAGEYEPGFRERLPDHPLVRYAQTHDNLVLTPHYGGATVDAWGKIEERTADLLLEAIERSAC
jgi:D-3-phosphoglycerate dehydrogenase